MPSNVTIDSDKVADLLAINIPTTVENDKPYFLNLLHPNHGRNYSVGFDCILETDQPISNAYGQSIKFTVVNYGETVEAMRKLVAPLENQFGIEFKLPIRNDGSLWLKKNEDVNIPLESSGSMCRLILKLGIYLNSENGELRGGIFTRYNNVIYRVAPKKKPHARTPSAQKKVVVKQE